MQALMGMMPGQLNTSMVKVSRFHHMLGNAVAVNVLERIFVKLLPAAGIVCQEALVDRWATSAGQHAAASRLQPVSWAARLDAPTEFRLPYLGEQLRKNNHAAPATPPKDMRSS